MDLSKLTKAHVFIIGAVVAVILGVAFYFLGPHKTRQNMAQWQAQLDQAKSVISTENAKKEDLAKAKREVREAQALWTVTERRKMPQPPIDLTKEDETSLTKAMIRLWQEPAKTVPMMEQFALSPKNVIVQTNFGVGGQPTDPRGISRSVIEWPIGNVQVQGTFPEILRYMKRWNQAGRLVAVDNFQLQGQSPFLTGSATITVYIFPRANPQQAQPQAGFGGGFGGFDGSAPPGAFGPGDFGPSDAIGPPGMAPGGAPGSAGAPPIAVE